MQLAAANSAPNAKPSKLSEAEKESLAQCEVTIREYNRGQAGGFHSIALACFQIQRDKLYREYATQAAYFKARFGFSRSHSLRLAQMGALLNRVSPTGGMAQLLASDAHLRPLLKLTEAQQDAVLELALAWAKMAEMVDCPAKLVAAARTFLNPPAGPREQKDSAQSKLEARFQGAVDRRLERIHLSE